MDYLFFTIFLMRELSRSWHLSGSDLSWLRALLTLQTIDQGCSYTSMIHFVALPVLVLVSVLLLGWVIHDLFPWLFTMLSIHLAHTMLTLKRSKSIILHCQRYVLWRPPQCLCSLVPPIQACSRHARFLLRDLGKTATIAPKYPIGSRSSVTNWCPGLIFMRPPLAQRTSSLVKRATLCGVIGN